MEEEKIIKGFIPELDRNNLPETLTAISMIKARYGPGYAEEVGEKIKEVKGICALYYVLGDYDFTAVIKAESINPFIIFSSSIFLIRFCTEDFEMDTLSAMSCKLFVFKIIIVWEY